MDYYKTLAGLLVWKVYHSDIQPREWYTFYNNHNIYYLTLASRIEVSKALTVVFRAYTPELWASAPEGLKNHPIIWEILRKIDNEGYEFPN